MPKIPNCQSIVEGDVRCPSMATHRVSGIGEYLWTGVHCAEHAFRQQNMYDHQGGCEITLLVDCPFCQGGRCYWTKWSDWADNDPKTKKLVLEYPDPADGTVLIRCPACTDEESFSANG